MEKIIHYILKICARIFDNLIYEKNIIKLKILNFFDKKSGLNNDNNKKQPKIIVSLTSIPSRLDKLYLCLETIMRQTMKPDKIILYLGLNTKEMELPKKLKDMQKRGLIIKYVEDKKLRAHTKYFYAMQEFYNDIIITFDDDILYNKNIIMKLYNSYLKYPEAVSCMRAHKITFAEDNKIDKYNNWEYEYNGHDALIPNNFLLATGVGAVLYPPHCMPQETFNVENINKLSLNNDDIWLKFIELKNNIKVVKATDKKYHPVAIKSTQEVSLMKTNVEQGENDVSLNKLIDFYKIDKSYF